jgi:hypothetical protein
VFRWPVREALIAYRAKMKESAAEQYRHDMLVWAATAPHSKKKIKQPDVPAILKEPDGNA